MCHVHYLIQIMSVLRHCVTVHSMLVVCSEHLSVPAQFLVGGTPIVGYVILFIRCILTALHIWRPSPEDASCRGDCHSYTVL